VAKGGAHETHKPLPFLRMEDATEVLLLQTPSRGSGEAGFGAIHRRDADCRGAIPAVKMIPGDGTRDCTDKDVSRGYAGWVYVVTTGAQLDCIQAGTKQGPSVI
jgi:hypothetical protein